MLTPTNDALLAIARNADKFDRALSYGGYAHNVSDVINYVAQGRAGAFVSEDGQSVLITEVNDTRAGRNLNIWLAVGDLEQVIALSRQAVAAAKEVGATHATFMGRRGWGKVPEVLADGWKPGAVTFSKPL